MSPSGSRRLAETNTNNSSCNIWPLKIKAPCCKYCSFRGDRIQWNFLGHTAVSGCEGFPTFRDLTPSQTGVLVLPNHQHILEMQFWCYQATSTHWRCSLGASKPPTHPEDAVLVLPNHQPILKMQFWCPMFWCYKATSTPWRCSIVATKPRAHPEDAVLVLPNHQHALNIVFVLPNHQHTVKTQSWCYQTNSTHWRRSLVATKPPAHPEDAVLVLPNHQHTLKMGTELVPQTPENLNILTRLSARKKFHAKAPRSFETSITTHPTTQLHKLDALQSAITASLTSKHDSHVTYISDSANRKDTEEYVFYCWGVLSCLPTITRRLR